MKLKMELQGDKEVKKALEALRRKAKDTLRDIVNTTALNIERKAKRRCPVDTGRLRASIRTTFYKDGLAAEVGTDVEYAPYVEFGTRPHWPPPGALSGWARRHKMPEFPVMLKIAKYGTAPKPFLFPAWEEEKGGYFKSIRDGLRNI